MLNLRLNFEKFLETQSFDLKTEVVYLACPANAVEFLKHEKLSTNKIIPDHNCGAVLSNRVVV